MRDTADVLWGDEQDKQPTGSAWPWLRICRARLTRQTKHEAVSAGASDIKWGVRALLPSWPPMRVRLRLFVNVILLIEQRSETRRGETRLIYHTRMEVGFVLTCLFVFFYCKLWMLMVFNNDVEDTAFWDFSYTEQFQLKSIERQFWICFPWQLRFCTLGWTAFIIKH